MSRLSDAQILAIPDGTRRRVGLVLFERRLGRLYFRLLSKWVLTEDPKPAILREVGTEDMTNGSGDAP